jgi:hypothetical protein
MSGANEYDLVVTPPARRASTERLPPAVAAAVIDLLTTASVTQPQRFGKPLRDELIVLRIDHRRDVYRPN